MLYGRQKWKPNFIETDEEKLRASRQLPENKKWAYAEINRALEIIQSVINDYDLKYEISIKKTNGD